MYTCPYCGTTFPEFRSNCKNCGGPLDSPQQNREFYQADIEPVMPPPAPRPITDSYAWKLVVNDGIGIVSLIFGFIGIIFAVLGAFLTAGIVTAFVGIPFFIIGVILVAVSVPLFVNTYNKARKTVEVLRDGEATTGEITGVDVNYNVRINGRNPWTITYAYHLYGKEYAGKVTTINPPGNHLVAGRRASVLYLPGSPEASALYPHP